MPTKKSDILPGDRVILSAANGLGTRPFTVLYVDPRDTILDIRVRGGNGKEWWARSEGIRLLPEEPEGDAFSDRYGDW